MMHLVQESQDLISNSDSAAVFTGSSRLSHLSHDHSVWPLTTQVSSNYDRKSNYEKVYSPEAGQSELAFQILVRMQSFERALLSQIVCFKLFNKNSFSEQKNDES